MFKLSKLSHISENYYLLFSSKIYLTLPVANIFSSRLFTSDLLSSSSHSQIFASHSLLAPFPSDNEIESVFDPPCWERLRLTLEKREEKFDLANLV